MEVDLGTLQSQNLTVTCKGLNIFKKEIDLVLKHYQAPLHGLQCAT